MNALVPPRTSRRARWFAARARNAARNIPFVASVGGIATVATLLLLVLVPREVDRAIRAEIEALPPTRDTLPALARRESMRMEAQRAQFALREARAADSALVAVLARAATEADSAARSGEESGIDGAAAQRELPRDAESADLLQRLGRARVSPLLESYRELAQASLMRGDARVREIIDSLGQIDREREAFAALGGPDARYAALSARMNVLGQRLVRIAEAQLARTSALSARRSGGGGGDAVASTRPLPARDPERLRELAGIASATQEAVSRADSELVATHEWNTSLEARRAAVRAKAQLRVPPFAMIASALVLGIAVGFAGSLGRELRTPRIADAAEAEPISGARVIVKYGVVADARTLRSRRRADRALPPVLKTGGEGYHMLHLSLTGVGEVARRVRVLADSPELAATVAANLAATAAREARAVLLVDLDRRHRLVSTLLRAGDRHGIGEVLAGDSDLFATVRDVPVGRDVYMTVLFGGRRMTHPTPERRMIVHEDLARLAPRYDLTVIVGDEASPDGEAILPSSDVILCAQAGVTPIAWLARAARRARHDGHSVRAVLLQATTAPVA